MSVAEMKESIVKKVILSDDKEFLSEVEEFINGKTVGSNAQTSDGLGDIDAFYDRLKGQYGDVLQKLAQ